jgi:hypothetical protein
MVRSHRAAPLRVTIAAWLRAAVLCRVLFPALMKAGAGKQNAVVVNRGSPLRWSDGVCWPWFAVVVNPHDDN